MLTNPFRGVRDAAGPASRDVVRLYLNQRKATRRLMHDAMQLFTKSDLEQAAKALGLWQRGAIVLEHEDLSSVVMNYALLEIRHEGLSTVERFRADRSLYAPDEAATVDLLCQAQFRLLTLNQGAGESILDVTDQLTGQNGRLVDVNLGATGTLGVTLATHVWNFADDYWMTTGAAVSYSKSAEQLVARRIRSLCRCKLSDWPKLGPRQRASVAALVIRCAIDCGSAKQLQYE